MKKQIVRKTPRGIVIKPEIRFGKPTVANTRITIEDILNLLKAGYTVNDIPKQYPSVTSNATVAALDYAASILGKEEVLTIGKK